MQPSGVPAANKSAGQDNNALIIAITALVIIIKGRLLVIRRLNLGGRPNGEHTARPAGRQVSKVGVLKCWAQGQLGAPKARDGEQESLSSTFEWKSLQSARVHLQAGHFPSAKHWPHQPVTPIICPRESIWLEGWLPLWPRASRVSCSVGRWAALFAHRRVCGGGNKTSPIGVLCPAAGHKWRPVRRS